MAPICGNCFVKSFSENIAWRSIPGMKVTQTTLAGVLLLEPIVFTDSRGFFLESYNKQTLAKLGIVDEFVQDNHSFSRRNVLRGLHYQIRHAQGKLVRAVSGEIFDVAVDLRRSSPTFGRWLGETLSGENKRMLWIPPGFAHGFAVVSENAQVLYKASDYYDAASERTLAWNDSDLNIDWQLRTAPILSEKDRQGVPFRSAELFE
jgi:dTDP-4-dehydrorhamnose 3,5-epimerase